MASGGAIPGITINQQDEGTSALSLMFPGSQEDKLKQLSELSPDLVWPMSFLDTIGQRYGSKLLPKLVKNVRLNENSKDRKGRIEAGEVLGAIGRRASGEDED